MDYKEFNNRKKEIFCNICCTDLLFDIIKKSNKDEFDDKTENVIQQLCELFSYVEQKKITETKINVLKFYRKINHIPKKSDIKMNRNEFIKDLTENDCGETFYCQQCKDWVWDKNILNCKRGFNIEEHDKRIDELHK